MINNFNFWNIKLRLYILLICLINFIITAKYKNEKELKSGISDINVLLPICESSNCNRVSHEIEAFGGCYEWKLDKPEFIDLELLAKPNDPQECHSKVRISPKNVYDTNNVVFLQAKDKNSNEIFKCRIGFGKIKKLKIIKRFDVINVGEIVELDVKGYDEKDNTFSSLEGFRFEWKISRNDLVEIIRNDQIKKLGEKRLEVERKYQSDIINLKGIATGKISLVAELIEESLKDLRTKHRDLYIIQPFKIFPEEPLYILANNHFDFDLTLQQNFLYNQEIIEGNKLVQGDIQDAALYRSEFPGKSFLKFVEAKNRKHYSWETSDPTCGTVMNFGTFESIKKNCSTKIISSDTRIDAFNKEENMVHVVEPTSLELGLYQLSFKNLQRILPNSKQILKNFDLEENIINDNLILHQGINLDDLLKNFKIDEKMFAEEDQFLTNTNAYNFISEWKLVAGNFYIIKNFLMYERHPIYFNSEDIKFVIQLANFEGYIKTLKCVNNNKICLIYAIKPNIYQSEKIIGETQNINLSNEKLLESKAPYSHLSDDLILEYSVSKKIEIYERLKIENFGQAKFYLPYLGFKNVTNLKSESESIVLEQELHLLVRGGSLKYRYFSSDRGVVDIRDGILYGRSIGSAVISVKDDEIENNFDIIEIEVKEIKDLNFFEERQEVLVNKPFFVAPTAILGYPGPHSITTSKAKASQDKLLREKEIPITFTNCTNLNLEPTLSFSNRNLNKMSFNEIISESANLKHFQDTFDLSFNAYLVSSPLTEKVKKDIFLTNNKKISGLKLVALGLNKNTEDTAEKLYIEYLKYSNYGVCKLFAFKSGNEGLIRMGFLSNIQLPDGKIQKINSNVISKIFIYSPLILSNPLITDSFTNELNMRTNVNFPNYYYDDSNSPNLFVLAPGSGVSIYLSGGIAKWTEYPHDYEEIQYVINKNNNYTASMEVFSNKFSFKGKNKEFYYECIKTNAPNYENNDYEIVITLKNKQDKTLINPAKSSISFVLGCQEPKYLSLFFLGLGFSNFIFDSNPSETIQPSASMFAKAQGDQNLFLNYTNLSNVTLNLVNNKDADDVLIIPQRNFIQYFQQKASFDGVRIYSFDENKRMMYNFTSYKGQLDFKKVVISTVEPQKNLMKIFSKEELNKLLSTLIKLNSENLNNDNIYNNIIEDNGNYLGQKDFSISISDLEKLIKIEVSNQAKNEYYFYRTIYFYNFIQKLELTYTLQNGISQSAQIEVIDIPTFSPNNSTIYLMENNFIFLDILYGSGDFDFSVNNNELASYEYSPVDRKIKITALKTGVFTISIKDQKIGIQHKSLAYVYISPIKKIELIGGGLLMVNDTAQVEVKVYNIYDHIFPIGEVQKMNLYIDKSSFNRNGVFIKSGEVDYQKTDKREESMKQKLREDLKFKKKEEIVSQYEIESAPFSLEKDYGKIHVSKYFYVKGLIADLYSISIIKEFPLKSKVEINLSKSELDNSLKSSIRGGIDDINEKSLGQSLKNILRSNYIKIEVFKRLEIYPASLLMVPGSMYTLSIKGGPSNEKIIVKKYEILNKDIASVQESEPQVKAKLVGTTILRITISIKEESQNELINSQDMRNGHILTIKDVPVKVDFPDSVEIIGAYNRKIYTKSTIRLFAALKLGKETFTFAYGPIKYNWLVDNSLIANLKFYQHLSRDMSLPSGCSKSHISSDNSGTTETCTNIIDKDSALKFNKFYNSIGTFLKTYKQGISDIKLNVEINYPPPYENRKPNKFSRSEKILIDDNIFVDISEFYDKDPNKSGLYLVPYNIDHDIVTNKNREELKYSLVSQHCKSNDPLIILRDNGKITTFDRRGLAYIMIEKKEIDNKPFMPLVLPVYVTEFFSVFVERSYQTIDMEVGHTVHLKVLLQHEYGLLFAEKFERFELRAEISNPTVAQLELIENNSKIRIHGNSKGQANIIILDPTTLKIYDVFNINVFPSIILPERIVLNIGAEVEFLRKDMEKKIGLEKDSEWIVDDPNILRIDPNTGKGFALREGLTRVHLVSKDLRKEKLATEILVSRVKKISVDFSLLPKYFTDIHSDPYYRAKYIIPIKYFINDSSEELSRSSDDEINQINQNIIFKCISKQPEIFVAEVKAIAEEDKPSEINNYCVVTIREISFDIEPPKNLELSIIIESSEGLKKDKYIYDTIVKIPFSSSFKIKDNIRQLIILKENRTQLIEISNPNDIDIEIQDRNKLLVHSFKEGEKNYLRFFVPNTVRENFENNFVRLTNRLTGQHSEINVSFMESEASKGFFFFLSRESLIDFVTAIVIISVIYIIVYYNFSSEDNNAVDKQIPQVGNPQSYQYTGAKSNLNFNKKSPYY